MKSQYNFVWLLHYSSNNCGRYVMPPDKPRCLTNLHYLLLATGKLTSPLRLTSFDWKFPIFDLIEIDAHSYHT